MQGILFLLILMGQYSFFTSQLYEYHFIEEAKAWTDAQQYCREKHTDLATVYDMADKKRLPEREQVEAWIGLYSKPGKENRKWHWSLPGVEYHENEIRWAPGEPNDYGEGENCVWMNYSKWNDVPCAAREKFVCYNEKQPPNQKFTTIHQKQTWSQAQKYCRIHHSDLVSGLNQSEECTQTPRNYQFWIGLFRDTWRWSDGSNSNFRNWDEFEDGMSSKKCVMAELNKSGKWVTSDCSEIKPFVCYEDNVILIKENKTWDEALDYCREKYTDLVSITSLVEQRWIQMRTKEASTPFVWLGLRYTCTLDFWFWVSDQMILYENWASGVKADDCDMSGAMQRGGQQKWFKRNDTDKFNFLCFKDPACN